MQLVELSVEGFKSFHATTTFNFADGKPGFYFVTGENKVEPDLGSNGAGKSTLLCEAIFWVLRGKTTRNLKARDIATWAENKPGKAIGTLTFNKGNHQWKVTRWWNPVKLWVQKDGGSKEVWKQEDLDELVGLNETCLVNSLLIPQFKDLFLDLKPAEKLAIFSEILELERWEEAASQANKEARNTEDELQEIAEQEQNTEGRLQGLKQVLAEAKQQRKEWQQWRDAEYNRLTDEVEKALNALERANRDVGLCPDPQDYATDTSELEHKLKKAQKNEKSRNTKFREIQNKLTESEAELNQLRKEQLRYENTKDYCPTCGNKVDVSHIRKHTKELKEKIQDVERRKEQQKKLVEQRQQKVEDALQKIGTLQRKIRKATEKFYEAKSKLQQRKETHKEATRKVQNLEKERTALLKKENPYKSHVQTNKKRIQDLRQAKTEQKKERQQLERNKRTYESLSTAFRNIRLQQVDQALEQFELEVNNTLYELGLPDWAVKFDIERENRSGGITKGFSVLVRSPQNHNTWVPWEAWSGGEGQRLRLAGTLGLSALIAAYTDTKFTQQVWDEPTAHLDSNGVQALLDVLQSRVQENKIEQVYLIDHHSLEAGNFDHVYTVTKDKDGSHLHG